MKRTSKGQVTIPKETRNDLGVHPHSEVEFKIVEGQFQLVKADSSSRHSKFSRLRGTLKGARSTDEWMQATRGHE